MAEREQLDDRALVARVLEGDRDRFTELVKRYEKRVVNYVYRITHRYEEAHDLTQEIFVKVFMALDRYDPKYQFSTWLFRIAQNSAIDALRKKSIAEVPLARPADDESSNTVNKYVPWMKGLDIAGLLLFALGLGLTLTFAMMNLGARAKGAVPQNPPSATQSATPKTGETNR